MKSFFKRSAISIVVLGMAGSAYAAVPVQVYNYDNWSPSFYGAFIGAEGLDLRAMNGDLDYVTSNPLIVPTGGSVSTKAINTSYNWDWRVYGGIKFTDSDDITVSWMQMRNSNSSTFTPPSFPSGFGLSTPRWLFSDDWSTVTGHVTFDLDDAYAVWGHTINFNNPWSLRFAAGVEYARLNSEMTVTAQDTPDSPLDTNTPLVGFEADNTTQGVGPRVEIDLTYHLPYGFALFGNANAALLVSTRDISLDPVLVLDTDRDEVYFSSDYSNRHVVIPKFGARLGASYSYVWGQAGAEGLPCRTTTLTVDAGWQVETYIHAIERPDDGFREFTVPVGLNQPRASSNFASTKTSNFGDSGFFVGIQLGTDWM